MSSCGIGYGRPEEPNSFYALLSLGLAVIFGCFAAWVVQRLFGRYLTGKNIWKDFAVFPLALFGLTLLVLGGIKLIHMIERLLRALT